MVNIMITSESSMTDIYLVRHGQASFGAANYDKLSDLGAQQSQWLGHYFKQRDITFDSVFMGDMVRHRETAEGIAKGIGSLPEANINSELNEFNFQAVATAFLTRYPDQKVPEGASRAEYYRLLKKAMLAWAADELDHNLLDESWAGFEDRVATMLGALQTTEAKRVLVVSSGGAIAMMLKHILGYDASTVINMNLQIRNASFSQCFANTRGVHLNNFNSVPHLDVVDRLHAVTYS
mgnify:FL=1|jgi:broad specificity phosphatase PhoE